MDRTIAPPRNQSLPATNVFFDTWAWWEFLGGTAAGRGLARKYVSRPDVRVHTSILTLAEVSAKLASRGQASRTQRNFAQIERHSSVHPIPREVLEGVGALRAQLRRSDPDAGIIEALVLAMARHVGAILISGDSAFKQQKDVRTS